MDAHIMQQRRMLRAELDAMPDVAVDGTELAFAQRFATVADDEPFFTAPDAFVASCRALLDADVVDTVPRLVHDTICVRIGCNRVPLFALVSGGRDRTLYVFRCVYAGCAAFLDVRRFLGADKIKWALMCTSHCHDFSSFPQRMPRNTFARDTLEQFREMVSQGRSCAEVKMECGVLSNKNNFQDAVRAARQEAKADQARGVRDAVSRSAVWASEVHLDNDGVFVEAFFRNAALAAKGLCVRFVFVDDTSCANDFSLPVLCVLCRDASSALHVVAWAVLKNRTADTFVRFFTFLSKGFPTINIFMCDRHYAQARAIRRVFGDGVHVLHCCVHVARNIKTNMGQNNVLERLFWQMRYKRTGEAEAAFVEALHQVHAAKQSAFTTRLVSSLDTFLPSRIDPLFRHAVFLELLLAKSVDVGRGSGESSACHRARSIIGGLCCVAVDEVDVFSADKTNAIEGFFSMIKQRLRHTKMTLLDLYNVVNFTEMAALASHHPQQPHLGKDLKACLLTVLSPGVLSIITVDGVRNVIRLIVTAADHILGGVGPLDAHEGIVHEAIVSSAPIETFNWMPREWVLSLDEPHPTHDVIRMAVCEETHHDDFIARLEPFMSVSHRNVDVFAALNDGLMTLHNAVGDVFGQNFVRVSFSFFNSEFSRFVALAKDNGEVASIIAETCRTLESLAKEQQPQSIPAPRRSIADPLRLKTRGPKTMATSSNVDHTQPPGSTKTVDRFQTEELGRRKAPLRRTKRRHRCPVCLLEGHHARTCHSIL